MASAAVLGIAVTAALYPASRILYYPHHDAQSLTFPDYPRTSVNEGAHQNPPAFRLSPPEHARASMEGEKDRAEGPPSVNPITRATTGDPKSTSPRRPDQRGGRKDQNEENHVGFPKSGRSTDFPSWPSKEDHHVGQKSIPQSGHEDDGATAQQGAVHGRQTIETGWATVPKPHQKPIPGPARFGPPHAWLLTAYQTTIATARPKRGKHRAAASDQATDPMVTDDQSKPGPPPADVPEPMAAAGTATAGPQYDEDGLIPPGMSDTPVDENDMKTLLDETPDDMEEQQAMIDEDEANLPPLEPDDDGPGATDALTNQAATVAAVAEAAMAVLQDAPATPQSEPSYSPLPTPPRDEEDLATQPATAAHTGGHEAPQHQPGQQTVAQAHTNTQPQQQQPTTVAPTEVQPSQTNQQQQQQAAQQQAHGQQAPHQQNER